MPEKSTPELIHFGEQSVFISAGKAVSPGDAGEDEEDVVEALKFIVSNVTKNWYFCQIELPYSVDFASFSKENYVISKKEKEDSYVCEVFINPAFKYKYVSYLK